MGCKTIKHTDGKKYFIPDCWGAVIHGKHACNCYDKSGVKMNDHEYINHLKNENRQLKLELKTLKNK